MSSILARLRTILRAEPALVAWALNGGIAVVIGFLTPLTVAQSAAITTITTALAALYAAVRARPVAVSAIMGAMVTIATAAAAFGLHVAPNVMAMAVAVGSAVLGLVFRANLTPVAPAAPLPDTKPVGPPV